jgi:hypothetical protein
VKDQADFAERRRRMGKPGGDEQEKGKGNEPKAAVTPQ